MVVYALTSAGWNASGFRDGTEFFTALKTKIPDMALLDLMLPGADGISILKSLRQSPNTAEIPVIILTAKNSELDRVKGLDFGADDYITKPFSVMELISRVRAVLRRCKGEGEDILDITVGGVTLSPSRRVVTARDRTVTLTYKEFELLHYMMINVGIVISRDKLLDRVWGYDYGGESRTIDMHVKSLRQKLGEDGNIIKTVRNVGYKADN
jgi:two-component system alkaline phosphatase synthesis response regulator PhoP